MKNESKLNCSEFWSNLISEHGPRKAAEIYQDLVASAPKIAFQKFNCRSYDFINNYETTQPLVCRYKDLTGEVLCLMEKESCWRTAKDTLVYRGNFPLSIKIKAIYRNETFHCSNDLFYWVENILTENGYTIIKESEHG